MRKSDIIIDYDILIDELNRIKREQEPTMTLLQFAFTKGFTIQRVYLLKNNPTLGPNFLGKLKKAGVDLDKIIKR